MRLELMSAQTEVVSVDAAPDCTKIALPLFAMAGSLIVFDATFRFIELPPLAALALKAEPLTPAIVLFVVVTDSEPLAPKLRRSMPSQTANAAHADPTTPLVPIVLPEIVPLTV